MLHIIITDFYPTVVTIGNKSWQQMNFGLSPTVPKNLINTRVQFYLIDQKLFDDKKKFLSVKEKIAGSIEDLSRDKVPVVLVINVPFFDSFEPGWQFLIEELPIELYEGEPHFHRVEKEGSAPFRFVSGQIPEVNNLGKILPLDLLELYVPASLN